MRVAKRGNSLAVRLPAAVVKSLQLKVGDEIELKPLAGAGFEVVRKLDRTTLIEELHKFRGLLPADFKFDRDEANSR